MQNSKRYYIIIALIGLLAVIYLVRLFSLQVMNKTYKDKPERLALYHGAPGPWLDI